MRTNKLSLLIAATCMMWITGCGGSGGGGEAGGGDENAGASEMETTTPAEPMEPLGTASISGTIAFNGEAPKRMRIRQDAECSELNPEPVQTEAVIVNDNGTLKNVFVYVKNGLEDYTFPTPSEPVIFDQRGCMYHPHVFGVQTGQTIKILNSDPLLHNIHALPDKNRPFNFGMPKKGDERERSFMTPEIMVKIKCDVHAWMGAWAGVVSHPYYDVSGDDGTYSLDGLPAGTYTLETWHEEYGTQTMTVTVGDGEAATADFAYSPSGA